MTKTDIPPSTRPPLHIIDSEYDAIAGIAMRAEHSQPELARLLMAELDRAEICDAASLPPDTAAMHSRISFIDEGSGASRTVVLVYPQEADIEAGKISILTHVGAGLIGMRAGSSILWPDRDGRERRLKIVRIERPAP
ncbi:nucleoside diphosphate kinase regulator [Edaphosphingomonas haloaromaticamans]|uniref:Regulator of nucleoside diphosphate kinase n=1 Tax=Edaphosphingomonas haloaromaticamans TaxID=653954 RepID=A0A1S1HC11_9SPHN|nr:nucleoside diphosphate kinase regulator [Sphingomonas haloaromaticamans]OHT19628.1 Regulator of nucleoside diphosphate kinase [Sphingomonas haloaromaticamans]